MVGFLSMACVFWSQRRRPKGPRDLLMSLLPMFAVACAAPVFTAYWQELLLPGFEGTEFSVWPIEEVGA